MIWGCFYLLMLVLSCTLTGILYRYARVASLLDIPNHRSSHSAPTPRGGGLAFVLCFLFAVMFLTYLNIVSFSLCLVLVGLGSFIALLGFIDDYSHSISPAWRLLSHFIVCCLALYLLGGMPPISFLEWTISSNIIINSLAVFYLVWLLNLYNFMDGIDGMAAVEAITVCLSGALLFYVHGYLFSLFLPLSLAVAVGGFLFWNFPPARIFMGDVGSGFLGFILGVMSIQAATINSRFFWCWLILLGVFIVDATLTLFSRLRAKEPLFKGHCNHAYQHACRYFGKHNTVTLGVLAINLFWLLPLAFLVSFRLISGFSGLIIAYLPLLIFAIKFNAGKNMKIS